MNGGGGGARRRSCALWPRRVNLVFGSVLWPPGMASARVWSLPGGVARVIPTGVRIWLATGHTDMRRGMHGLALQVQEGLGRNPFAGDIYIFRGRSGSLIKALWH